MDARQWCLVHVVLFESQYDLLVLEMTFSHWISLCEIILDKRLVPGKLLNKSFKFPTEDSHVL